MYICPCHSLTSSLLAHTTCPLRVRCNSTPIVFPPGPRIREQPFAGTLLVVMVEEKGLLISIKCYGLEMTHIICLQNSLVRTGYTFLPHHKEDRKSNPILCLEGRGEITKMQPTALLTTTMLLRSTALPRGTAGQWEGGRSRGEGGI